MTRAEYYRNYKLSRKLSLLDLTWVVFMLATFGGLIGFFDRNGWFDSWFIVILSCLVWAMSLSILMNWIFTKKRRKFNLTCSACQNDISHSVSMTIITGKCQKCGCDLFDLDTTIELPPYIDKTKLLEFRREVSKQILVLLIFWVISFVVLLFLIACFNCLTIKGVGGFMAVLMVAGLYLIVLLPFLLAQKKGFICPKCKGVLCHSRMEIAIKTNTCSKCGKKLFEDI